MKDKKKIIFNAVFLILCFSLTLFYVFKGEDFKAVLRFIRRAEAEADALLPVFFCGVFLQPRYADGVRRTADAACLYG